MADSLWQTENSRLMCKERERERERERETLKCVVLVIVTNSVYVVTHHLVLLLLLCIFSLGLDIAALASASRFWPRLTSLLLSQLKFRR